MIIQMLVENQTISEEYPAEHGLSIYVDTLRYQMLFDVGQTDFFMQNAQKMGIDLQAIDYVVLSHGHYDHGGGLKAFFAVNDHAPVFVQPDAFHPFFSVREDHQAHYIGLETTEDMKRRFVFTDDQFQINDEMTLFAGVTGNVLYPQGNRTLFEQTGTTLQPDRFIHEQNLIIKTQGITVLFAGCAHHGIINIIERAKELGVDHFDYIVGGFHLYNHSLKTTENPQTVAMIGEYLKSTGAMILTCHCTGEQAYGQLKDILGNKIRYFKTGNILLL